MGGYPSNLSIKAFLSRRVGEGSNSSIPPYPYPLAKKAWYSGYYPSPRCAGTLSSDVISISWRHVHNARSLYCTRWTIDVFFFEAADFKISSNLISLLSRRLTKHWRDWISYYAVALKRKLYSFSIFLCTIGSSLQTGLHITSKLCRTTLYHNHPIHCRTKIFFFQLQTLYD